MLGITRNYQICSRGQITNIFYFTRLGLIMFLIRKIYQIKHVGGVLESSWKSYCSILFNLFSLFKAYSLHDYCCTPGWERVNDKLHVLFLRTQFSNFSIQTILGAGSSGTQRKNDFTGAAKNETLLTKIKQEKIEILGKNLYS